MKHYLSDISILYTFYFKVNIWFGHRSFVLERKYSRFSLFLFVTKNGMAIFFSYFTIDLNECPK